MKTSQLNRILRLVRRTGDRFVILDQETSEVFALMGLSQYEDLLDETEQAPSFFEDIHSDEMDEDSEEDFAPIDSVLKDRWDETSFPVNINDDKTHEDFSPLTKTAKSEVWNSDTEHISSEVVDKEEKNEILEEISEYNKISEQESVAEEIPLNDVPHDEEEEEDDDTFLLEPVDE
jgi:hypothetical protein